jgi:hypothetical protein
MVKILSFNLLLLKEASIENHTRTAQASGKTVLHMVWEKGARVFPMNMYGSFNS